MGSGVWSLGFSAWVWGVWDQASGVRVWGFRGQVWVWGRNGRVWGFRGGILGLWGSDVGSVRVCGFEGRFLVLGFEVLGLR